MPNTRVLVVDDESSVRNIIRYGLKHTFPHIDVDSASNGREAREYLEKDPYDLVICDWEIPHFKGDEILEWMRATPALSDTPFIMLSAKNEKSQVLEAFKLGASSYVVKPFTIVGLIQKMAAINSKFKMREFDRYVTDNPVSLDFDTGTVAGTLIDISHGGLFGAFRRSQGLPQILERVGITIESETGGALLSGMQGFIVRIQAAMPVENSETVNIAVKFRKVNSAPGVKLKAFLDSLQILPDA